MSLLPLTLACWTYDRVTPLKTGRVSVEGVDLNMIQMPVEEMFYRIFHHHEFDIVEMSLSAYMMARAQGEWAYEAIPVFLSRMFRHSAIFIRANSGIKLPEDLKKQIRNNTRVEVMLWSGDVTSGAVSKLLDQYEVPRKTDRQFGSWLGPIFTSLFMLVILGAIFFFLILPRFRDPFGSSFLINYIRSPAKRFDKTKMRTTFIDNNWFCAA